MKRKVSRVEAIIIMQAAREFRQKANAASQSVSNPDTVLVVSNKPKIINIFTYLIDFIRKMGT